MYYSYVPIPSRLTLQIFFCFKTFIKVVKGLDNFLFKLVILRVVKDHSGNVWRRKSTDMYVVEITTDKLFETLTTENPSSHQNHSKVSYLYCLCYLSLPLYTIHLTTVNMREKPIRNSLSMLANVNVRINNSPRLRSIRRDYISVRLFNICKAYANILIIIRTVYKYKLD